MSRKGCQGYSGSQSFSCLMSLCHERTQVPLPIFRTLTHGFCLSTTGSGGSNNLQRYHLALPTDLPREKKNSVFLTFLERLPRQQRQSQLRHATASAHSSRLMLESVGSSQLC